MNVLYLTRNLTEAEFLQRELEKAEPKIRLESSLEYQDAAVGAETLEHYDAILLDRDLPGAEALSVIAEIRKLNLPIAVVVLIPQGGADPPIDALRAGIDDYLVKNPGYPGRLPGVLRNCAERYRPAKERDKHPLHVLYAGDFETARRQLAEEKRLVLEPAIVGPDGSCWGLEDPTSSAMPYDAVVLDDALTGAHLFQVLKDVRARAPEVPAILLLESGKEELAIQGLRLGAADYVFKLGRYYQQMMVAVESSVARRNLAREKNALLSTEMRLRMVIETVPACVILVTPDGNFLAMNWAGLSLVGAQRADDVVGRNFFDFLPPQEMDRMKDFIERICSGERDAIQFEWSGLNKIPRTWLLRAVPMRRDAEGITAMLGVISDLSQTLHPQMTNGDAAVRLEQLHSDLQPPASVQAGLEEQYRLEQEKWEAKRKELERQREVLVTALRAAQARQARLVEERAGWDKVRTELESIRATMEDKIRAAQAGAESLAVEHQAKQAQWEALRQGMEQQLRAAEGQQTELEAALRAAEARFGDGSEERQTNEAQRGILLQELENLRAAQVSLEGALREADSRQSRLTEEHGRESAAWAVSRLELEQELKAAEERQEQLEDVLQNMEARLTEADEHYRTEKAQWDLQNAELENLKIERDALDSALRDAGADRERLAGQFAREQASWDAERRELGQRLETAEQRSPALEEAIRAAEERLNNQDQKWRDEQARAEHLHQALEGLSNERAALEQVHQKLAAEKAQLTLEHGTERIKWESAQKEIEQKLRLSSEQQTKLENALVEAQKRVTEVSDGYQAERAGSELLRQELDTLRDAHAGLEAALRETEAGQARLAEERSKENSQWEVARQGLEQQLKSSEEQRAQLEAALEESRKHLAQISDGHQAEQSQSELLRQELDTLRNARAGLEAALREAEAGQARLAEERSEEIGQWEAARQELEHQLKLSEEQRSRLEATFEKAGTEFQAERTQWGILQQELSTLANVRAGLEAALREAIVGQASLAESQDREKAEWEAARQELEQRLKSSEEQRSKLEAAFEKIEVEYQDDRAQCRHLQQELDALTSARAALEAALREAEADRAKLASEQSEERSQWEAARQELEQQLKGAAEKHEALNDALRKMEARLEGIEEDRCRQRERGDQWQQEAESLRGGKSSLEALLHTVESERALLEEERRKELVQWEALRADLNQQLGTAEEDRIRFERALEAAQMHLGALEEGYRAERASLEASLEKAVADSARLSEDLARERARQAGEGTALAQQQKALEEQRAALAEALRAADARYAQLEEVQRLEREQWDAKSARLRQQLSALEESLRSFEARQLEYSQEFELARVKAESVGLQLEQQRKSAEEQRASFEGALRASEVRHSRLEEEHRLAVSQWEAHREKLEQHQEALEGALLDSEATKARLIEDLQEAQSHWDQTRNSLELQQRALEDALRKAEGDLRQLSQERRTERSHWEKLKQELEQRRTTLEEALRASEGRQKQLLEEQREERQHWEGAKQEVEHQRVELERLRRLLRETTAKYQELVKQQSENFQQLLGNTVARSQRDAEARIRLLNAHHEEERESLDLALREANARLQRLEVQSIAGQKRFEGEIRELQERSQRLFGYSLLGLAVTSTDGRILECNDAFAHIFGFASAAEVLSQPEHEALRSLADREALNARLLAEGRLMRVESSVRRADGRVVWVLENATLLPEVEGKAPVVERTFLDVTERHALYEEIRRSRRMEAVGRMAFATMNEFNDLLTSMVGCSELVLESLDANHPRRKQAERILEVANRAGSLARQLLTFSRKQERAPEVVDLNSVIRESEVMLRRLIGDDFEFVMALASDLAPVAAMRQEIDQVLTTLAVNARDALPVGGTVTVETANVEGDPGAGGESPAFGAQVLLTVKAAGYGAQPAQRTPNLDSMVGRCGGSLRVGGEPEVGVYYRLYLPRAQNVPFAGDPGRQSGSETEKNDFPHT